MIYMYICKYEYQRKTIDKLETKSPKVTRSVSLLCLKQATAIRGTKCPNNQFTEGTICPIIH